MKAKVAVIEAKLAVVEESNAANALVKLYASRRLKELEIKDVLTIFADTSFHSPIFCHRTLPIVMAHFITGLDVLPAGLNAMPAILKVRGVLFDSFKKLIHCEIPVSKEQIAHFRSVLEEIDEAHAEQEVLHTMAVGILELKEHISAHRRALVQLKKSSNRWSKIPLTEEEILPYEELEDIQAPIDFCNRCMVMYNFISRMLLNLDFESPPGNKSSRVGMVDLEMNLEYVVRNAVEEAKQICTDHYGDCPDTEFILSMSSTSLRFPYMSTTIRYIIMELMKNAFRATVESHMKRNSAGIVTCEDMPPVHVLINLKEGAKHACVCISDEGMGMTQKAMDMAMAYSYTSVNKPALELNGSGDVSATASPLAGYGYGLPMSRVYARSLGGDLILQTMEGFGTRAYYYIKLP